MILATFEYPEWLDEDSDSLVLKNNAPEDVKVAFKEWLKGTHGPFAMHLDETDGFKIDDLL